MQISTQGTEHGGKRRKISAGAKGMIMYIFQQGKVFPLLSVKVKDSDSVEKYMFSPQISPNLKP